MRAFLGLCLLPFLPGCLAAQGPGFEAGRFFADTARTTYRLGFTGGLLGPLGTGLYATLMQAPSTVGNLWGLGGDLTLLRGGRPGLYLVGGFSGGFGIGPADDWWSSYSAGAGYEVRPFEVLSLGAEGRWRVLNPGHQGGLEVSVRLGVNLGSGARRRNRVAEREPSPPDSVTVLAAAARAGVPEARAELLSGVVQTAISVMGTPYRWGGEGEADGFDCSGLIHYAYGQHGVLLPRRSVDQAREGRGVDRSLDALVPGDILTFSKDNDRVTHVGLYVGDGKFIHSATGGVQLSVLSPDDTYGRWWWKRWVGARRVVE